MKYAFEGTWHKQRVVTIVSDLSAFINSEGTTLVTLYERDDFYAVNPKPMLVAKAEVTWTSVTELRGVDN